MSGAPLDGRGLDALHAEPVDLPALRGGEPETARPGDDQIADRPAEREAARLAGS